MFLQDFLLSLAWKILPVLCHCQHEVLPQLLNVGGVNLLLDQLQPPLSRIIDYCHAGSLTTVKLTTNSLNLLYPVHSGQLFIASRTHSMAYSWSIKPCLLKKS